MKINYPYHTITVPDWTVHPLLNDFGRAGLTADELQLLNDLHTKIMSDYPDFHHYAHGVAGVEPERNYANVYDDCQEATINVVCRSRAQNDHNTISPEPPIVDSAGLAYNLDPENPAASIEHTLFSEITKMANSINTVGYRISHIVIQPYSVVICTDKADFDYRIIASGKSLTLANYITKETN